VKEAAKTEGSVQGQERQAKTPMVAKEQHIPDDAQRRDAAPCDVYIGARPRNRQVWILSEIFCVVREVQEGCRGV
jgi:hypothetical protein